MAELMTIARPYAEAVFAFAKENNALSAWSELLGNLSTIATDEAMVKMTKNPAFSGAEKVSVFKDVMGAGLTDQALNLLNVLAENGRLSIISEISSLFETLKADEDKKVLATVYTAIELTPEQTNILSAALNAKFNAEVELQTQVDASLISGVKIKVGDWAIDGSALSQLSKLGAAIAH